VTTLADFTDTERALLVGLPRWIVAAASDVQHDNALRTNDEIEAGFVAVANGRAVGNPFVAEIANRALDVFDTTLAATGINTRTEAGIDAVLEHAGTAWALVKGRAAVVEAEAYRRWLLTITDDVIAAAKSDGVLGIGGALITPLEQRFRDRLASILR
jgi:hypothetical protein